MATVSCLKSNYYSVNLSSMPDNFFVILKSPLNFSSKKCLNKVQYSLLLCYLSYISPFKTCNWSILICYSWISSSYLSAFLLNLLKNFLYNVSKLCSKFCNRRLSILLITKYYCLVTVVAVFKTYWTVCVFDFNSFSFFVYGSTSYFWLVSNTGGYITLIELLCACCYSESSCMLEFMISEQLT
jgi:hypothetical protein